MPGTIQVSVLELKGMASSSPPSSVLVKVSLGKIEYQTWDKGDFSFPLTTLRDSLVVAIQDAEGNELSNIGVHSMEIVEKGIWDDLFPLEGGGHVPMKLQFSLSEDDRNRIRSMRELALKKKKHMEALSNSVQNSRMATDAGDSVASSSTINHEVSGSAGKQDGALPYPDTFSKDLQSNNGNEEATLQKHLAPNVTDNNEESSYAKNSSRTESHHMSVQKIDNESLYAVASEAPNFSHNDLRMSIVSEPVVAKIKPVLMKQVDTPVNRHEKQVPLRKPANSIRKMISAFETTLVQEKKPPITQVAAKSISNKARKEGPLSDQVLAHVTEAPELNLRRPELLTDLSSERPGNQEVSSSGTLSSPAQTNSARLGNIYPPGKFQFPPDSMHKGKQVDFHEDIDRVGLLAETKQLLISYTSNAQQEKARETLKSELKTNHEEMEKERKKSAEEAKTFGEFKTNHELKKERKKLPEVLMKTSLGQRNDIVVPEIMNTGSAVLDASIKSDDRRQHESSGAWIFPNDTRRMCVTTGVNPVVDLYDSCHADGKAQNIVVPKKMELHAVGSEEMKESGSSSLTLKNTDPECSSDNAFTGPMKQAIKIATVVGFGALVLFTRQK